MSTSCPYHSLQYYAILWIGTWVLALLLTCFIGTKTIYKIAWILWFVNILLMLYMSIHMKGIKGARRWIFLFNRFSYQPSELMKLSLSIIVSYLLTNNRVIVANLVYLISSISLIMQPDLGNTFIVSIMYIITMIITQISIQKIIYTMFIMIGLGVIGASNLSYAKKRLRSFSEKLLNKKNIYDSYQNFRAIQAIQNGGFIGVGAGMGNIKKLLPDAYSDFIFAVILEELGAIGGIVLCLSFLLFQLYCIYCTNRLKSSFESVSITSISSLISIQAWIHMGSSIWLIPTKGTTLPLISHGGVSTLVSHIIIGLILNFISAGKKVKAIR